METKKIFRGRDIILCKGSQMPCKANLKQMNTSQNLALLETKSLIKIISLRYENVEVWELEIKAAIKLHQKDYVSAIKLAKQATLIEAKLPAPSGPPRILKPTYELLGEVYLKANEPLKAKENFEISLKAASQ